MASTIKVDNIQDQCGSAVVTKCGASKTLTVTTAKANNYQAADGGNIINQCGTTITLGASGDTITLACGASQTGFGRTGTVNWNTTKITADPANAVSGTGYFADTTSAAFTITLPTSPSAGDIVAISDYASNFKTNNVTVGRNGSNIEGSASDYILNQSGVSVTLVYVDATKGWIVTNAGNSSQGYLNPFIEATGGTITTCGDYKIHTFTGPGTFCVSNSGTPLGSTQVDYLIAAGAGGGGFCVGGGGGAGGYRESHAVPVSGCYTASPLASPTSITVSVNAYPVTVGAGGSAGTGSTNGGNGSNSVALSITSAGGGGGGTYNASPGNGSPGGSGGGAAGWVNGPWTGGSGNTPPVSPPQGNSGGNQPSNSTVSGAGGGGAGGAGSDGPSNSNPTAVGCGPGGPGTTSSITGTPVTRAAGGTGRNDNVPWPGTNSAANSANGGEGAGAPPACGGAGGSGIVIIRYKYQ